MNEALFKLIGAQAKTINLPSEGKFGGKKEVSVRGFVTKDEKELLLIDDNYPKPQLRKIAQNVVIDQDFDIKKCIDDDIIAILMTARYLSYGDEIRVLITCNNCDTKQKTTKKITDDLEYKKFTKSQDNIKLKMSGFEFDYSILTVEQQEVIERNENEKNKLLKISTDNIENHILAASINKVKDSEGNELNFSFEDKVFLVENLPKSDMEDWRIQKIQLESGYTLNFNNKCSSCGHEGKFKLLVGYDFFYSRMPIVAGINL